MSSFLRDLSSVGISKFLIILFGIGRAIITARYLGPEGNGIIAALAVYPSLFMTIGSLGIRQSTAFYIGKNEFDDSKIRKSVMQIWCFSTILSLAVCFFLIRYFSNAGHSILWVFMAIAPIPFNLFNTYSSGFFLGKNRIKAFNKINWIPQAIYALAIFLFLVGFSMEIEGALLAAILGPLAMTLILIFRNNIIRDFSLKFNFKVVKALFSLGLIYAISLLVIQLNTKVDIIILDKLSSPYETGIYSKGVTVTEYLWHIPMLISTLVFARSAISKNGFEFSRKVVRLLRVSSIIIGLCSFLLLAVSKQLILLMYGDDFMQSAVVLKILLPGVVLLTVFKTLNQDLAGKGKPWVAMKAMVPALIINLILNFFLIPEYGANGAAATSTLSYIFAVVLFLHFYSVEVKIPIKQIFKFKSSDWTMFRPLFRKKSFNSEESEKNDI